MPCREHTLRKISLFRFIAGIALLHAAILSGRAEDFRILSSNPSECVIAYSPEPSVQSRTVQGVAYQYFDIRQASPDGQPGDPMIPCRTFLIGIPWQECATAEKCRGDKRNQQDFLAHFTLGLISSLIEVLYLLRMVIQGKRRCMPIPRAPRSRPIIWVNDSI